MQVQVQVPVWGACQLPFTSWLRPAEDVVEGGCCCAAVLPCCSRAGDDGDPGAGAAAAAATGASAGQVIGSMGDDEDGWINGESSCRVALGGERQD